MAVATIHITAADLKLNGSYEPTGDVLYLSTADDDKQAAAQKTPEGHAVRLDNQGRITHLTGVNAKWLIERDGAIIATLRDGRRLLLEEDDVTATLKQGLA